MVAVVVKAVLVVQDLKLVVVVQEDTPLVQHP